MAKRISKIYYTIEHDVLNNTVKLQGCTYDWDLSESPGAGQKNIVMTNPLSVFNVSSTSTNNTNFKNKAKTEQKI